MVSERGRRDVAQDGATPAGALPLGVGRRHGTSASVPFDRWFRYPAGFASDYVATLLDKLSLPEGQVLVDPFAGSAVSGTAARTRGLGFHGVEAHPLVAELGRLKVQAPGSSGLEGDGLPNRGTPVPATASILGSADRTADPDRAPPGLEDTAAEVAVRAKELLATAPDDVCAAEVDLVRACFSTAVLTDLVCLRDAVRELDGSVWQPYLKWALLATLRDVASVKVGWPYQRPGSARNARHTDATSRFLARAGFMADDLAGLPNGAADTGVALTVVTGDSRLPAAWKALKDGDAAGCLTSPPYLNNFDYADATRLELYFWTALGTWREMCDHVRAPMLTATTQQSSRAGAAGSAEELSYWPAVSEECKRLVLELAVQRRARGRGKEYDQVLPAYLAGVGAVLRNVARVLRPGAPCILLVGDSAPYGVYVDTPALLAGLGAGVGLMKVEDRKLRERGGRWATSGRHTHPLAERMIVLRRE
jgi:hypothetical protein